jgi:hypothetical protein
MHIINTKKKHKPTVTRPDYVLKDIPKAERGNLPPRMKILFWMHLQEETVPAWMFEDCRKNYPQYFERDFKLYGRTK